MNLDQRIIGIGAHIVKSKATKISYLLPNYLIRDSFENDNSYNWLDNLISLFNTTKILLENIKRKQPGITI